MASEFEAGFLIGILVGEGHFGGDGRQPQVTLRMHVRHEPLFRWIENRFPGGRLYGPYHHSGREYFQWMARGEFLREHLVPILERWLTPELDRKAFLSFSRMRERYGLGSPAAARLDTASDDGAAPPFAAPTSTSPVAGLGEGI